MTGLDNFVRKHDYLVCVDSDGCAMDTMNCKHIHCFGPCMVTQWGLETWEKEILQRWNEINLFQMTRGINRFKGLAQALGEIDARYTPISGVKTLQQWADNAPALSNDALAAAIDACADEEGKDCLRKALAWSVDVNKNIVALPEALKIPFPGARDGLEAAHRFADVAVVSSANRDAVDEEWTNHRLFDHVDIVLAQDVGSKVHCIARMLEFGYEKDHVLMVGDAPGDLDAAARNGVLFYPILVNREEESWTNLRQTALGHLAEGSYHGEYQEKMRQSFLENLGG